MRKIKAIQDNKEQPVNVNNDDDYKNKLLISQEREIFKDIYNKRLDKIGELNKKVDHNDLKYTIIRVMYNRVFWHTLSRTQNNNYKNQIKK